MTTFKKLPIDRPSINVMMMCEIVIVLLCGVFMNLHNL
jgi:hypothetical protein